jgi:hypothetical protein
MLAPSHNRHVDRVPAEAGHASFGKVLPHYIPGRVQIGVNLISAFTAAEDGLGQFRRQPAVMMI